MKMNIIGKYKNTFNPVNHKFLLKIYSTLENNNFAGLLIIRMNVNKYFKVNESCFGYAIVI